MPNSIKKLYVLCSKDGNYLYTLDTEFVPHLCVFEDKNDATVARFAHDKIVCFTRQEKKATEKQRAIYAVELDVSYEAAKPDNSYWLIHREEDNDGVDQLCVYITKKEALRESKGRDHKSRVVKFVAKLKEV